MSGKIIPLRDGLTDAQIRRVVAFCESELAKPTRNDSRSLCQDLGQLVRQIEVAAHLAGALSPKRNRDIIRAGGAPIDRIFLKLYEGAESLMFKAMDESAARPAGESRRAAPRMPGHRTRFTSPRE